MLSPMNKQQVKTAKNQITGIIKRHADGFGFLIPDDVEHADVYIPKHFMLGIMSNDKVLIEVIQRKGEKRFHGEILKVVNRGTKSVVGRIIDLNDIWRIIPDDSKAWGSDLKIKHENSMQAKNGDLVHVEILHYPNEGTPFTGKVIEVIGKAEDPLNDVKRVLRTMNIPTEFSQTTITEASVLKENPDPSDYKGRINLQQLPLITIDGATAKDFDDAVYTKMTPSGFHLYVAIADVSHYVRPGSAIDKDAYERGTSVYFPNYVVPMIPEKISNGLCSLKPHVPRLCVVAEIHFDFQGNKTSSSFYEAVMESKARVTYGEAQEVVDGTEMPNLEHVKENILRCSDLAKVLMAKRFKEGSLDLNISETELEIDAGGNPVDVQKSERLFAHRLIEELMLAANVAVAEFLESKEIAAVYRVHEDPSLEDIKLLEVYLFNLGAKIHLNSGGEHGKLQKKLTKALEKFADHPQGQVINILTLRSLSQARYSTQNIGHFGLGFKSYTHFTSPIRRYPDLIVHRLLKSQILNSPYYLPSELADLTTNANMLSLCEQRSVKCERQFYSIKKARFMQQFIGKEFQGLISSVTKFGIFVLLREYDIDGLVKLENLGNDKWVFDEENLRLVGQRTKKIYSLGVWVSVIVTGANIELGQIDFNLNMEKQTDTQARNQKDLQLNARTDRHTDTRPPPRRKGKPSDKKHSGKDRPKNKNRGPVDDYVDAKSKSKGSKKYSEKNQDHPFKKFRDRKVKSKFVSESKSNLLNEKTKLQEDPKAKSEKPKTLSEFLDAHLASAKAKFKSRKDEKVSKEVKPGKTKFKSR
jgi:ribonuclease R